MKIHLENSVGEQIEWYLKSQNKTIDDFDGIIVNYHHTIFLKGAKQNLVANETIRDKAGKEFIRQNKWN